jgi:HipA-like C-terminal domain
MTARSIISAVAERLAQGVSSAAELAHALGVSQTTLSRAVRALERDQRVLRMGSTRGARYARRRAVAAIGSQWPVYLIDEEGTPQELGALNALERNAYYVTGGPERIQDLFEGIAYYLQDARPAGFLGRATPAAYPELGLPARVIDWTDEHVLTYLTHRGVDTTGNLIVGTEALNRYLAGTHAPAIVSAQNRITTYPALATAAMAGAPPSSSAGGEHPKFTACVVDGERRTHVIVKFSPPKSTPTGQRWADLLTAEYLAHRVLEEHGIPACRSALLEHDDRVFLECERFDRAGADGRRGAVSLVAIDAARYGKLDNWTAASARLASDGMLSTEDAERIRFLDAFGALTANSDRHLGNVTLFDRYEGPFELAPVYDMLPMLFSPQNDQIVVRPFEPAPPTAAWLSVWPRARSLAQTYWECLAQETGVSAEFRALSAQCLTILRALPARGALAAAS